MKNKKRKWIKFRHGVYLSIAKFLLRGFVKSRYSISIEKFNKEKKRPYLILYNHQTAFDQFFVALSFKGKIYYVASEDLFSNGFVSKLLKHAVAPIPIKKQTTDPKAVMDCIRVAREGGSIAIAPEGNRTFSGKTEHINPSIAKLAKLIKLPIVFFRIEGGYGVHPRWSDKVRKGKMRAFVSRIIEPEEFLPLTDEQLNKIIKDELFVLEATDSGKFKSKVGAEYLERLLYVCPHCGLANFYSEGDTVKCLKCGKTATYNPDKTFTGDFGFKYVNDWYEYQQEYISNLNLADFYGAPAFTDRANLFDVVLYKKKRIKYRDAEILLYGNKIIVKSKVGEKLEFNFDDVTGASVLGRNKLNVYCNGKVYQLKGGKRFNAVKYVNFYYANKNATEEKANGKFLGL